jgi:hypothetical protein
LRLEFIKKFIKDENEAVKINDEISKIVEKKEKAKVKSEREKIEKKITHAQLSSLRGYIDRNLNENVKRITTTKPISEVAEMSDSLRLEFIKKFIKDENEAVKINDEISKIVEKKEKAKVKSEREKIDSQFGMSLKFGDKRFTNKQQFERFVERNLDGYVNESLGLSFSRKQMDEFQELGENIANKKALLEKNTTPETIREYGKALLEIGKYTDNLSESVNVIRGKNIGKRVTAINESELSRFDKAREYALLSGEIALDATTSVFRTMMATGEVSFMGIQSALKMTSKNYWKSARKLFIEKLSTPEGYANLQADIIGHPSFKQAVKDDLTFTIFGRGVSKQEDNFSSILMDKLAGIGEGKWYQGLVVGRIMQKAERAQSAFLTSLRFNEYVKMTESAKLLGENMKVNSKIIAQQINDHTGGAYITPKLNYVLSKILFSPRNTVSAIKTIVPWRMLSRSRTARAETIKNYIGLTAIIAGFTGLSALKDYAYGTKNTEYNPAGNKFGKIKIGETYYDNTFGRGTIIRLLAKQVLGYKKTSSTDTKTELGKYYGGFTEETRAELLTAFARGKLAPHASLIVDLLDDAQNAIGQKLTPMRVAKEKLVPMYVNSVYDASKDPSFEGALGVIRNVLFNPIVGFVAIAPEFFSGEEKWENETTKEKKQFLEEKGEETVRKANFEYNMARNKEYAKLKNDEEYQKMSNDERLEKLKEVRDDLKKDIFTKYGFEPKK